MQTLRKIFATSSAVLLLNGCATRTTTVIDTSSDWVRLARPVQAKVETYQGNGVWAEAGTMTLPQGWFAGPGPKK